jgi:hypothetical protein
VGSIERVEVNASHVIIKEISTLLGSPVDADPRHGGLVAASSNGTLQSGRESGSEG